MDDEALAERTNRLDAHLDERDLDAAWFATPAGFAWLVGRTAGRTEAGRRAAVAGYVRGDGVVVVVDSAEADRIVDDGLPDGVTVERVEWYESSPLDAVAKRSPSAAAADVSIPGFESLDASRLRTPLFDDEVPQFRRLGRETAAAVERVCRELQPGDTEREVASGVRIGLAANDIEPVEVRVGGSVRAAAFPRPTPGDSTLGAYAVVSVTALSGGRHVSLSRTVTFAEAADGGGESADGEAQPAAVESAHADARTVATRTVEAAREAETAADIFAGVRAGYADVGRDQSWRAAPAAGAVGYAPREWVARPDADDPIRPPTALAVTPRVSGVRVGETVLLDGTARRLTATGEWPTAETTVGETTLALPRPLRR